MKWNWLLLLASFVLIPEHALSYEIETHAVLTAKAYTKVTEEDAQLVNRLGLSIVEDDIDRVYYDISNNNIYERTDQSFENTIIEKDLEFLGVDKLAVPGWLLRGAIREDDGTVLLLQENPQDDPYGNINRFFRHFFDPVNNTPLGVGDANYTAPAWGLGTTNANAFSNENSAESGRRNHYSIKDAREYMYRAVTGRSSTGSKAIAPNGSGGAREPNDDAEGEQVRKAYWATTFRALGDVVHLIQDMGQPQHTRNDGHGTTLSDATPTSETIHA